MTAPVGDDDAAEPAVDAEVEESRQAALDRLTMDYPVEFDVAPEAQEDR